MLLKRRVCRESPRALGFPAAPAGKEEESGEGQGEPDSHGCGQVTAGIQQEVRDTVLVLIAAIPEGNLDRGEPGGRGGWVGNPQPGVHVPHPHSTPAPLSTALDMGFVFSAPFRHRTAVSHAFA